MSNHKVWVSGLPAVESYDNESTKKDMWHCVVCGKNSRYEHGEVFKREIAHCGRKAILMDRR